MRTKHLPDMLAGIEAGRTYLNKRNRNTPFSNYVFSFDIETTSWTEVLSSMYVWTLGGADYRDIIKCRNNDDLDKVVKAVTGRTWKDFDKLCYILSDRAQETNCTCIVLAYNLAYEWSYMQKNTTFIRDNIDPGYPTVIEGSHNVMSIKAGGLLFLDAKRLFGLGSLAQNATRYGFVKYDYDYDVKRHSRSKLTTDDYNYNANDVKITLGSWCKLIESNGYRSLCSIPLTQTSLIRDQLIKNNVVNTVVGSKKHWRSNGKTGKKYLQIEKTRLYDEAVEIAKNVFPSDVPREEIANLLERAFSGGYTHCNIYTQMQTVFDVASIDLGSAYPAAMLAAWYPRKLIKKEQPDRMMRKIKNRLCVDYQTLIKSTRTKLDLFAVVTVDILNIKVKTHGNRYTMPLISRHKLLDCDQDALFDNGKLVETSKCKITCTTIDLSTWMLCYDFEIGTCYEMYAGADLQQLPQYWLNAVDYCYNSKTILKNTLKLYEAGGDWATEYRKIQGVDDVEIRHVASMETHEAVYYLDVVLHQRKAELNGLYGIMVMHIIRENYIYNANADIVRTDDTIRKAKDGTCYLWGVIVTSIVRLWEVCASLYMSDRGCLPLYWDTDSIKMQLNGNDAESLVDDLRCFVGDIHAKYPALGAYDYEGTYDAFRSVGSKRYIALEYNELTKVTEWHSTVAGLPKKVLSGFLTQELREAEKHLSAKDAVTYSADFFRPNLFIDESATDKLIPRYVTQDKPCTVKCTDVNGKTINETFYSGARLTGIQFAVMSLDSIDNRRYQRLCDRMQGRSGDIYPPITISIRNNKYTVTDGELNVPDIYTFVGQRDRRLK